MRKRELLAYAAGIVDGEGCISIGREKRTAKKTGRYRYKYKLFLAVSSTTSELILFMQAKFGGTVVSRPARGNRQQLWVWRISARETLTFLKEIQPFLLVKTRECSLAIEFQEHKRNWKAWHKPIDVTLGEEKSYWEMRRLNRPSRRLSE